MQALLPRRSSLSPALNFTAFAALTISLAACLGSQTRPGRLQDAAVNFNTATRFGRMDLALEMVDDKTKTEFIKQHQSWGRSIRVLDVDFQGMNFAAADQATVFVAFGWQRHDEPELRVTNITQSWRYKGKGWRLMEESRSGGDVGLLGDGAVILRPERRPDVHFPSTTIR